MVDIKGERIILSTLIIISLAAGVGGNIVRQKVFFHKPFLFFGDGKFSTDTSSYSKSIMSDSIWYDGTARAFLNGRGISSIHLRVWWRQGNFAEWRKDRPWFDYKRIDGSYIAHMAIPPLYPLFLALCYYIGGENTISFFIPQLILGALTCVFIYLLAKEIFNEKIIAALAGFAVALYPELIFWRYQIRTETLYIFLLVLGFWFLIKGNLEEKVSFIFISAAVFGLASLTRITFIFFIPLLFVWQIFFLKMERKKRFAVACSMMAIIFLILLPWCVRNFLLFNKFSPLTTEAYAFLFQESKDVKIAGDFYQRGVCVASRITGFIMDHPKGYALSCLSRFTTFWSPYTDHMKPIAKIYKGLGWLAVFPLGLWGIIASRKAWRNHGLITLFIFYYSIFHAASFVDSGLVYRYPILPFLCLFFAYGFWDIKIRVKNIKGGRR